MAVPLNRYNAPALASYASNRFGNLGLNRNLSLPTRRGGGGGGLGGLGKMLGGALKSALSAGGATGGLAAMASAPVETNFTPNQQPAQIMPPNTDLTPNQQPAINMRSNADLTPNQQPFIGRTSVTDQTPNQQNLTNMVSITKSVNNMANMLPEDVRAPIMPQLTEMNKAVYTSAKKAGIDPQAAIAGPDGLLQSSMQVYGDTPMAKVAAAQAILESGLTGEGKGSSLARQHKNLFGIKGRGTAGSVNMGTKEFMGGRMQNVRDDFAANKTYADSFQQHRRLMNNRRYREALNAETPEDAIRTIHQGGYATDPNYQTKIMSIINRYF